MPQPLLRSRRGSIASGVATVLVFAAVLGGVGFWVNHKMKESPGSTAASPRTNSGQRMTYDPTEANMSFESLAELYNPNLEGAPEDWSLIETLNSDELQALALKVDSLSRNYEKLERKLLPEAQAIFPTIDRIKPILWDKLLKKNWKDPKLPLLYHELAKDRPDAFDFLLDLPFAIKDMMRKQIIAHRIESSKDYLLGGKIRAGDRRFVETSAPFVESRVADLEKRLGILKELVERLDIEMKLDGAEAQRMPGGQK